MAKPALYLLWSKLHEIKVRHHRVLPADSVHSRCPFEKPRPLPASSKKVRKNKTRPVTILHACSRKLHTAEQCNPHGLLKNLSPTSLQPQSPLILHWKLSGKQAPPLQRHEMRNFGTLRAIYTGNQESITKRGKQRTATATNTNNNQASRKQHHAASDWAQERCRASSRLVALWRDKAGIAGYPVRVRAGTTLIPWRVLGGPGGGIE